MNLKRDRERFSDKMLPTQSSYIEGISRIKKFNTKLTEHKRATRNNISEHQLLSNCRIAARWPNVCNMYTTMCLAWAPSQRLKTWRNIATICCVRLAGRSCRASTSQQMSTATSLTNERDLPTTNRMTHLSNNWSKLIITEQSLLTNSIRVFHLIILRQIRPISFKLSRL